MNRIVKWLAVLAFSLFVPPLAAFEILALGTSNTNCLGVEREQSFTVHLQSLLRAEGHAATVVNGGVDGDKPFWMIGRMNALINENTRLVIFEPGPNDRNKSSNVDYSERILAELQRRKIPAIYVSHPWIQNLEEARNSAQRYGAYYYGHWTLGVPVDRVHRQYDTGDGPGHMTGAGCMLWAKSMVGLVQKVINDSDARNP